MAKQVVVSEQCFPKKKKQYSKNLKRLSQCMNSQSEVLYTILLRYKCV